MLRNRAANLRIAFASLVVLCCTSVLSAQQTHQDGSRPPLVRLEAPAQGNPHRSGISPQEFNSIRKGTNQDNVSSRRQPDDSSYFVEDPNVQPAAFHGGNIQVETASNTNNPATASTAEASEPLDLPKVNEFPINRSGSSLDLGKTIQKIALSTLGVLVACVVFLIGIKKFGMNANQVPSSSGVDSTQVVETANIGGKTVMQLVRMREYNILIVRDSTGIKSVVNLPNSFRDELDRSRGDATSSRQR